MDPVDFPRTPELELPCNLFLQYLPSYLSRVPSLSMDKITNNYLSQVDDAQDTRRQEESEASLYRM
jgi:hypothetical protein